MAKLLLTCNFQAVFYKVIDTVIYQSLIVQHHCNSKVEVFVLNSFVFIKITSVLCENSSWNEFYTLNHEIITSFLKFFFRVRFCRFYVVIQFFHPCDNGQWSPTLKDFYTKSYPLHYCLILILQKEPVFPFSMLSAKQGNYWYHFYNVFGMTRSLTGDWNRDHPHSKPALYH